MMTRRRFTALCGTAALLGAGLFATRGIAHHGWAWAEGENHELTGVIKEARLGNPHGELIVTANGEDWIVEVGQPWRNARAGLTDSMLVKGVELTAQGHRHKDRSKHVLKAERIIIKGKLYNLYPDRD